MGQSNLRPSESVLEEISKHLDAQQKGLDHLLQMVEKDMKFLHVMEAGYGLQPYSS
jgi:hypothetical protein